MIATKLSKINLKNDLKTILYCCDLDLNLKVKRLRPPTKGEGGHIGFSADPVGVGVGVGVTDLYPRYLLNQLMEFHQICLDISLGQA